MALAKTFNPSDGLNFSTRPIPDETPRETNDTLAKVEEKSEVMISGKRTEPSIRFEKTSIKKRETKNVRKQFLIKETDNKRIEEECRRLEISQNEFINLLIKRYFS